MKFSPVHSPALAAPWIVAALLLGCNQDARQSSTDKETEQVEDVFDLQLVPVGELGDTDSWALPYLIDTNDDHIAVFDLYADPMLVIVDKETRQVVNRLGRRGNGPGEVRAVSTMTLEQEGPPRLWVFDDKNNNRFSLFDFLAPAEESLLEERNFNIGRIGYMPYFTSHGAVAAGVLSHEVVIITDSSGADTVSVIGKKPFPFTGEFTDFQLNALHKERHPSRDLFAITYRHADRVDIYRSEEDSLVSATSSRAPQDFNSLLDFDRRGQPQRPYPIAYPIRAAASNRFIYAPYCGCAQSSDGGILTIEQIRVFDWQGRYVGTLQVGPLVIWAVGIAPDDSELYVSVESPDPRILVFDMTEIVKDWITQ